ncbi:hypothetical protein JMJ56_22325 [Belnapia sp. T18]|uniref:Antitoxin Xre/MbcA/ParS-like toxin-binding domain-containing protein n=1 Tax=Belnapia arida TaxID=2804533 RepID=A0ABS1UBZ7_9PROT|nr:hypothetical protein [Belnapia arida]MBL6080756.1 hypothetical protein [Belnapia arida]
MQDDMEARFQKLSAALLQKAGGTLSLEEAAQQLRMGEQELHDKIQAGGVLGMVHGEKITIPRMQIVLKEDKPDILSGISESVDIFDTSKAGRWAALQFLVEPDPNLGRTPIEALKGGEVAAVIHAARARLRLDEE